MKPGKKSTGFRDTDVTDDTLAKCCDWKSDNPEIIRG